MPKFLLLWWYNRDIRAALADDYATAKALADQRNAVVVEILGTGVDVRRVEDWYRRNNKGEPLLALWRDLEKHPQRID